MRKIVSMKHPVGRRAASMLKVMGYSHLSCKREYGPDGKIAKSSAEGCYRNCAAPSRRDAIAWLKDGLGARLGLRSRDKGLTWRCEASLPGGWSKETADCPTAAEALDLWIIAVCHRALTGMEVEGDFPAVLAAGSMGFGEATNVHSAAALIYDKADVVVEALAVRGKWAANLFYPDGSVPLPVPFDTMHEAKVAGALLAAARYLEEKRDCHGQD